MTSAEYKKLKSGDKVWCFSIAFNSGSLYGTLAIGLIAELERTDKPDEFKVIQVKKGTSIKVGKIITLRWSRISVLELFTDYNEGVDYWNSVVLNEVDRLTSAYEKSVSRVRGKLLKKK